MFLIQKIVKRSKNYSIKESDRMRLLRTITIGIIALIGGLLLGLILFVLGGKPESWQNWQYGACYAVPLCAFMWGIWIGWKSYEKPE